MLLLLSTVSDRMCVCVSLSLCVCRYYTEFFGNTTNTMTLNWDVNMHTTDDTELVSDTHIHTLAHTHRDSCQQSCAIKRAHVVCIRLRAMLSALCHLQVPMFPAKHRQYMATFIELWRILNPHTFVPQRYTFIAHGTPMGIPQNFTGVFRAADTVVQYC